MANPEQEVRSSEGVQNAFRFTPSPTSPSMELTHPAFALVTAIVMMMMMMITIIITLDTVQTNLSLSAKKKRNLKILRDIFWYFYIGWRGGGGGAGSSVLYHLKFLYHTSSSEWHL